MTAISDMITSYEMTLVCYQHAMFFRAELRSAPDRPAVFAGKVLRADGGTLAQALEQLNAML